MEAFSPVMCNAELLTMEHNVHNREYSCKDRLSFKILIFGSSRVQLTCHCTLKKAAAHLPVVTSNWQTASVTLTVAKFPRYDLDEEQHWHLKAL